MKYRNLGSSGLKVSVAGLGSWLTLGNTLEQDSSSTLVQKAFELGVNLFDTADVYKRGKKKEVVHGVAELALGASIKELPRHCLVLATKCFFPLSDDVNDKGLSRKHVLEACDGSLKRLGVDYIDLYQCHRYDPETPLLETVRAMDHLVRQGKVLYWGTSSWTAQQIADAVALCEKHGLYAPISNQPEYNLFARGIERDIAPQAAKLGLGQICYSPMAQGVLSGKYLPGQPPPEGSRGADDRVNKQVKDYLTDDKLQKAQAFKQLAEKHGMLPSNLALAFCLQNPHVAAVLVGARTKDQLKENLKAVDLAVAPELMSELDAMFPVA